MCEAPRCANLGDEIGGDARRGWRTWVSFGFDALPPDRTTKPITQYFNEPMLQRKYAAMPTVDELRKESPPTAPSPAQAGMPGNHPFSERSFS